MNVLEDKITENIYKYIEDFKQSNEYVEWKKLDNQIYLDNSLRPLLEEKQEMEKKFRNLDSSSLEFQNLYKDYLSLIDRINLVPVVQKYNQASLEIRKIKNILERELFIKMYE